MRLLIETEIMTLAMTMTGLHTRVLLLLGLLWSGVAAAARAVQNPDTLVFYGDDDTLSTYAGLLGVLEENGLAIVSQKAGPDEEVQIYDLNEEIVVPNVVVLPNRAKKLASNIDHASLLTYANNGGNLVIVSQESGTQLDVSIFLNQLGIYPSPKGYKYTDFHSGSDAPLAKIESPHFLNKHIVSEEVSELSLADSAVALISNSEYLVPLLKASRTSFTTNGDATKDSVWHTGNEGYLSVAFQGLNNGRVLWLGSPAPLMDASFNKELVNSVVQWTFQLKSVIRATFSHHKRVDASGQTELPFVDEDDYYKIKDTAYFEIGLSRYDADKKTWVPYTVEEEDAANKVQLEFVMLDPYYRLDLNHTQSTETEAVYAALFQLPDQHGMFTFSVDYKRPGLSYVKVEDVVPVRHLANDEYARSWEIPNSSVYMAGYGVVVVGWLAFVVLFLFSGKRNLDTAKKNI